MLHQLARFCSVAPLIEELGGGDVLDVGSGAEGMAGWLGSGWTVTALDRSFGIPGAMAGPGGQARHTVVGDARALPFGDGAFDVVLALDVLEHIAPADRGKAMDELVRAARRRVIVACPTGRRSLAADARLAAGLRRRGMTPPGWLLEHETNGFPERQELQAHLAGRGRLRIIGNENLVWHEWLFRVEFRRSGRHLSRTLARMLARGLGSDGLPAKLSRIGVSIAQGPDRPPRYRTIAVLDLDEEVRT